MKTEAQSLVGQIFQHYRNGKNYEVVAIGWCTDRDIEVIFYKPLYPCEHAMFTRSYHSFFEQVENEGKIVPRFKKL